MDDPIACVHLIIDHCAGDSGAEFAGRHVVLELAENVLRRRPADATPPPLPLIVNIEGLDGVGKSTCLQNLGNELAARGVTSMRFKTPTQQLDPYRSYFDQQSPELRRAYYQMCNLHLSQLLESGAAGDAAVALVDRWWPSTYAYGNAEANAAGLFACLPVQWPASIVAPDLCFVLVLSDDSERARRIETRGEVQTSEELALQRDEAFRRAVVRLYLSVELAREIDVSRDPLLIAREIATIVQTTLGQVHNGEKFTA